MEASALTHKDITNSNMKDILQKNKAVAILKSATLMQKTKTKAIHV